MSGTSKWSDAAVKDLTFAILMSNNPDGSVAVNANWDRVAETMSSWGYNFTKSAMSQHWSKKVLKEFKERHGADNGNGDYGSNDGGSTSLAATPTNKKTAAKNTPHKSRTPKTPKTGGNKKRAADDDTSPDGPVPNPIAQTKASRSVSKKVKYEETKGVEDGESDDESDAQEAQAKVEEEDGDFGVA